jgi:hypothetical protein
LAWMWREERDSPHNIKSGGVGGHWVQRRERAAAHNDGEEGGRRVGGGGISPVLSIEGLLALGFGGSGVAPMALIVGAGEEEITVAP